MIIPLAERFFIKYQRLERKMDIGGVCVITTKKKREKGKRKQMEDKRIKRKMVKTDADAAHAQSMELLELNTMSSSLYRDTDVITLKYQSQNRLDFPIYIVNAILTWH
ncbi:hypothetical protein AVEN_266949-1 [Araneus ventricosus]|uniref:Uncharacterized protein n=1 Tax=Araneus ventricosus TaxID=182803 RepID=A0A4Y2KWR3_ARAVE|nr:hypothetical protein AVEN_266949-1 [Araneus ventricosus]